MLDGHRTAHGGNDRVTHRQVTQRRWNSDNDEITLQNAKARSRNGKIIQSVEPHFAIANWQAG
jgi:hypothetical protein